MGRTKAKKSVIKFDAIAVECIQFIGHFFANRGIQKSTFEIINMVIRAGLESFVNVNRHNFLQAEAIHLQNIFRGIAHEAREQQRGQASPILTVAGKRQAAATQPATKNPSDNG